MAGSYGVAGGTNPSHCPSGFGVQAANRGVLAGTIYRLFVRTLKGSGRQSKSVTHPPLALLAGSEKMGYALTNYQDGW